MPLSDDLKCAARGTADALADAFERYGTFGRYINLDTGAVMMKKGTAGAIVIAALALASRYFDCERYLTIARLAGEYYFNEYVSRGITSSGPTDALAAYDSESCYGFVESYVTLYEITGEKKWLDYARHSTHLFSSWVMTYAYRFPPESELGRLGVNTVGSVFANVQNKHSAPGICTYSGDAIYRLYKYTGEVRYLDLIRDIAYFIPQCVSTSERPIYDWDHSYPDPEGMLPEGYICERVNTSDWEGERRIGGVFNCSCWCETSLLLTYLELMDKPEMK